MKRRLTLGALLLGTLLAGLLGSAYLLLTTPAGNQWLLQRIAATAGVEIHWQNMSGTLVDGLDFHNLSIQRPGLEVSVGQFKGQWQLLNLLGGSFHIDQLQLDDVNIEQSGIDRTTIGPWPALNISVPISLHALTVNQLHYRSGDTQFTLDKVSAAVSINLLGIRITELTLVQPTGQLAISGKLGGKPPYRLNLNAKWQLSLPGQSTYTGDLVVGGNLADIRVKHRLLTPFDLTSEGSIHTGFDRDRAELNPSALNARLNHHWQLENTQLPGLSEVISSRGKLASSGSLADYRLQAQMLLNLPAQPRVPSLQISLSARGNPNGLDIESLTLDSKVGTLTTTGDLNWRNELKGALQIDLAKLTLSHLTDKVSGQLDGQLQLEGRYVAQQLTLETTIKQLVGTINNHPANLKGQVMYRRGPRDLSAPTIPATQSRVDPVTAADHISIDELVLTSGTSTLQLSGELQWPDNPRGTLHIDMTELAPEFFTDKLTGKLNGQVQLEGRYVDQELSLQAITEKVYGVLNGYPLNLEGQLAYQGRTLSSSGINLRVGDNHLLLEGKAAEQLRLRWRLNAPNLAALYPPLTGKLESDGLLTGTRDKPRINGKLRGRQLSFAGQRAGSLNASLAWQQNGQQTLELNAADIELATIRLDQLNLEASGQLEKHDYQFAIEHPAGILQLMGSGHYRERAWQTRLVSGDVRSQAFGAWRLTEPVSARVSLTGASLEQHCWQHQNGQVCPAVSWAEPQGIALDVQLHQLPADLLQPWLPQQTILSGSASGELALKGQPDDLRAQWSLRAPMLQVTRESQPPRILDLKESEILGSLQQQVVRIRAQSRLLGSGRIDAALMWPLQRGQAVTGSLNLHLSALDWLDPFLLSLEDLNGQADGEVTLTGTTDNPRFSGKLRLSSLSAHVPELGVTFQNGEFNLTHQQQHDWRIIGNMDSGNGSLALTGSLLFKQPNDWQSQLNITGQDVQVLDLETIRASLSPDLTLLGTPNRFEVKGDIAVPSAEIHLKELPRSAVTVSEDQIIVDAPERVDDPETSKVIHSDINFLLGEHVQFNGFGIKGHLSGKLNITEEPGQPSRTKGVLTIRDGSYQTFGQKLRIDTGRLIFQGDADRPLIHVTASRTVDNTLVGIRIDGMPDSLTSEVYSTPALPQTEAMALLITGKPLASASETDASILTGAATALGFSQSEGLTQQLQNYLGLDILSVSSEAGIKESALTVGKYLTPRLYVGYIQDIMSPNAGVELEYSITEKIKIKAESGETQSMDILLRLDHE